MWPQLGIWKRFIRILLGVDRCGLSWGSGRSSIGSSIRHASVNVLCITSGCITSGCITSGCITSGCMAEHRKRQISRCGCGCGCPEMPAPG